MPAAVCDLMRTILYKHSFPEAKISILDALSAEASKVRGFDLKSFITALQVWRSVLMLEKAKKEGCDTLMMGAAHARHLQQLGYGEHEYHYSPLATKDVKNTDYSSDIRDYKKYEQAFKKALKQIQESKQ